MMHSHVNVWTIVVRNSCILVVAMAWPWPQIPLICGLFVYCVATHIGFGMHFVQRILNGFSESGFIVYSYSFKFHIEIGRRSDRVCNQWISSSWSRLPIECCSRISIVFTIWSRKCSTSLLLTNSWVNLCWTASPLRPLRPLRHHAE